MALIKAIANLISKLWLPISSFIAGVRHEKASAAKRSGKARSKVRRVRDALHTDNKYLKRLRDKYRR